MILRNDIGCSCGSIDRLLSEFPLNVDILPASYDIEILTVDTNLGTQKFLNSPIGLLITKDNPGNYGGVTYPYGATTVYWTDEDKLRTGKLARKVFQLRVVHELLHHFGKNSDNIADWLDKHPIYEFLYIVLGGCSGETRVGIWIQTKFYKYLCDGIDEQEFNKECHVYERDFRGRDG